MKTGKILLGGLAGTVTFFLLGWLVYGVLLSDYTVANTNQSVMKPMEDMSWGAMILSNLGIGLLLATVLGWSGTTGWMGGLKVGGVVGFLVVFSFDTGMYAMSDWFLNLGSLIVDVVVFTILVALTGIVVALVMGKKAET